MPESSGETSVPEQSPHEHRDPGRERTLAGHLDALAELAGGNTHLLPLGLEEWRRMIRLEECRRRLSADAPVLTVLLGPTGAGKSTVANALVGSDMSEAGAVRPCTMRPVLAASAEAAEFFRADPFLEDSGLAMTTYELDSTDEAALAIVGDGALVDTPDFDSVEPENRRRAELLLLRADRVVLIVNPDKYADRSVWDTIERLEPLGNLHGCIFNKDEGKGSAADCTELLTTRGLAAPIVIPRQDVSTGLRLSPELHASLLELVATPPSSAELHRRLLEQAHSLQSKLREEHITPWIVSVESSSAHLDERLAAISRDQERRVAESLPLKLDDALRRELLESLSAQVDRIDVLREPRRWVAGAFRWMRNLLPGGSGDSPGDSPKPGTAAWLTDAYRDRFQEVAFDRIHELRDLAREAGTLVTPSYPWEEPPSPADTTMDDLLQDVFTGLEREIAAESERIAQGLPMLSKLGFYGSQVAVHGVALTIFVKTGGLTGGEVATQAISSPLLSRLVGHLISEGEAAAVEKRLEAHYLAAMGSALDTLHEPLRAQLARVREVVPSGDAWRQACASWDREGTDASRRR